MTWEVFNESDNHHIKQHENRTINNVAIWFQSVNFLQAIRNNYSEEAINTLLLYFPRISLLQILQNRWMTNKLNEASK